MVCKISKEVSTLSGENGQEGALVNMVGSARYGPEDVVRKTPKEGSALSGNIVQKEALEDMMGTQPCYPSPMLGMNPTS